MSTRKQTKGFLLGALAGGIAGSITALLLAPKAGKELRKDISEGAGQISETTGRIARQIGQQAVQIADKTKLVASQVKIGRGSDKQSTDETVLAGANAAVEAIEAEEAIDAGVSEAAAAKESAQ